MLPVVDPTGKRTSRAMLVWSLLLIPAAVSPVILMKPVPGAVFAVLAGAMGIVFFGLSLKVALTRERAAARRAFFASIIHLPLLLVTMVIGCAVSALI